ncbi:LPXTG cell wall anchor domain-containing protein [Jiangella aurantiaca]|nr:LPXTG cell wall anchor domain-containing protein [Jiangella aurantiaca]
MRSWRRYLSLGVVLALMSSLFVLLGGALPAQAVTPEYEIRGTWVNPPPTVSRGNPVVAEWRVNVNDADEPPSNDPVDNVVATFTVEKAIFDEIPDLCLTEGVDPPSSISEDGMSLTCNFGPVAMGTAIVVQTPVVATGLTGEEVVLSGTGPNGDTVELPPLLIRNTFAMDIHYGGTTEVARWNSVDDPRYVDVDIQWSLRLGKGSDPGPQRVTYRLNMAATTRDGTTTTNNIRVGVHPEIGSFPDNHGDAGCTPFDAGRADGHPWSEPIPNQPPEKITSFVDTCTLTPVAGQPGVFDLTLEGINYDLTNVPSHDSSGVGTELGNPLPPNWDYIATGSLWFRVLTTTSGSLRLDSNEPTYTSTTGLTSRDLPGNNVTNKSYTLPGNFSGAWYRGWTGSGGRAWDDTYRVSAGTTVVQQANAGRRDLDLGPNDLVGNCNVFDTQYVTYAGDLSDPNRPNFSAPVMGVDQAGAEVEPRGPLNNPPPLQYYTGPVGNPNNFDCGSNPAAWSTTEPADLSTVTAVRIIYPFGLYEQEDRDLIQLLSWVTINDDVPVGQDVWMFGSALRRGEWIGPGEPWDSYVITPTEGDRYPATNGRRDILRIVTATPYIQKAAAQTTVRAGAAADFTLTYSANGSGIIPETVDGYRIVDTLPVGMTYVAGSADPEPVVSMSGGRQVLTWTLDGVPTNEEHELTYQAMADEDIEPGTQLTNTASSSYGGETYGPVEETVTTSANGYTTILKTTDPEYIPYVNEEGVGQGSWTVTIESHDPQPQAFTDTIDILPYIGDQRGTDYSGTYTLSDVVLPNGGTVYYTAADPATLFDDPAHPDNGAPNAPSALWSTTRPENPTAIRVIGGELAPSGTFAFQVVIETEGAQPQDVYVNRAEARAEHTELVMRTSAPLYVSDYSVAKTSDPAPGSTVKPGDTITYTITVTQEGPVPAAGAFTDTLEGVLDDAVYNEDATADIGTVTYADGVLSWEGVVPVGEVATITYTVTVKDVPTLEADGADTIVDNSVWSPGCPDVVEGDPTPCEPDPILVGYYKVSKTSDPAPGSTVGAGDVITYHVQITQYGEGAVAKGVIDDDLTEVLDDATWNDDATATSGTVSYAEPTLSWTGPLAVGEVVDLTYSVTANAVGEGDDQLHNVVTSVCPEDDPECTPGPCVPAPDENPNCETTHIQGDYEVMKTSDPVTGSEVEEGDVITYTVTVTQVGPGAVEQATFADDLTQVLDDATFNDDAVASSGPEPTYEEPTLSWAGPLAVGEVVTVTYSVTVTGEGDRFLKNVVTTGDLDKCVPAEGQAEACTTEHINGGYTFAKTSDPVPGSVVDEDGVITYTVLISHVGTAPAEGATIEDDLSAVLDDAEFNDDAAADSGEVSFEGETLTWTGDLEVGQVVTLTYSVTANAVGEGDDELVNVVTDPTGEGVCVPAEDGNEGCTTDHYQGEYTYAKTSDPEPGSEVEEGEVVTYTVTVEHVGAAPIEDAIVVDDLSQVAEVADWNDDATATSGQVSMDDEQLTWTGDLEVGQVVTITYSVTVGDKADATMRNVVTSPDENAVCVPAADGNPGCQTEHHTPDAGPDLPDTGTSLTGWFLTGGMALLIGGLVLAATHRRRPWSGSGGTAGLSS